MTTHLIWSNEHRGWWKANSKGYTVAMHEAGRYTKEQAIEICQRANINNVINEVPCLAPAPADQMMADFTHEQIERAGRILKVLRLAGLPGMDAVAIKLNCGLTWEEQQIAQQWANAFSLARDSNLALFDAAAKLHTLR